MLIRHKKTFNMGILFAVSFIGVLVLIFSPIFPGQKGKLNGLEYSDELFNKLSKGSSYFIPEIGKNAEQFKGKPFSVTVTMDSAEAAGRAVKVFTVAGAQAVANDKQLTLNGDLGATLASALADSDAMYKNEGAKIAARYGFDDKEVMSVWWSALNKSVKELQKAKKIEESNVVLSVMRKGIEPSYNFYGIESQRVIDKAFLMTGLLVFYVLYTMWWGYAIFYLFDGMGLSMKKAKVKKEV